MDKIIGVQNIDIVGMTKNSVKVVVKDSYECIYTHLELISFSIVLRRIITIRLI